MGSVCLGCGLTVRVSRVVTLALAEALSWQPHTVRGAIAGVLKKKFGLQVTSERDEKRGRIDPINP